MRNCNEIRKGRDPLMVEDESPSSVLYLRGTEKGGDDEGWGLGSRSRQTTLKLPPEFNGRTEDQVVLTRHV